MRAALGTKRAFLVIVLVGMFTLAARNIEDPDFWWHLRTGQYIFETQAVPHVDPFSFTRQGQAWIAHEWLSELFLYLVYRTAGWGGLILTFALLTAAAFWFLYLRCSGKPYVAAWMILWGAFVCRPTWGVRPQTLSILFASFLLWILETCGRDARRLWAVVPLTLAWANFHAGYSLGIALLCCFLVGDWLDRLLGAEFPDQPRPPLKTLALVLVISLAVVVLNPNGWRLYSYPFATFRSAAMQSHIAEWFSPDFHEPEYAPLLGMLLALPVLLSIGSSRPSARSLLLLCASTYAALQSIRLIPIFVLIAVPELSAQMEGWLESRRQRHVTNETSQQTMARSAFNAAIAIAMILFSEVQVSRVIQLQPQVELRSFPVAASAFLEQHPPGRLFNYYNWGGYLIWKLYPEQLVFIDGRADLYGDELLEQFARAYGVTENWSSVLDQWRIKAALLPADSPLAAALVADKEWKVLFRDEQAVLLRRALDSGGQRQRPEGPPGPPEPEIDTLKRAPNRQYLARIP